MRKIVLPSSPTNTMVGDMVAPRPRANAFVVVTPPEHTPFSDVVHPGVRMGLVTLGSHPLQVVPVSTAPLVVVGCGAVIVRYRLWEDGCHARWHLQCVVDDDPLLSCAGVRTDSGVATGAAQRLCLRAEKGL